jgi:hypothetical protein
MMAEADVMATDIIAVLKDTLTAELKQYDAAVKKLERAKTRLTGMVNRLSHKDDSERALDVLIARKLRDVEGEIEARTEHVVCRLKAVEILDAYEHQPEERQQQAIYQGQGATIGGFYWRIR